MTLATLHLPVYRDIGVPIFRQIYDGLRGAILEGRLRPGQRIPSTRSLATDLGVSRLPVLSAYEQLLHARPHGRATVKPDSRQRNHWSRTHLAARRRKIRAQRTEADHVR